MNARVEIYDDFDTGQTKDFDMPTDQFKVTNPNSAKSKIFQTQRLKLCSIRETPKISQVMKVQK